MDDHNSPSRCSRDGGKGGKGSLAGSRWQGGGEVVLGDIDMILGGSSGRKLRFYEIRACRLDNTEPMLAILGAGGTGRRSGS